MKRMKKLLAFLLAAMLLLSMIPISASAAKVSVLGKEGYFTLSYDDGGLIDSTVTVILKSPQGVELDQVTVGDAKAGQQNYKVALTAKGSDTYDIESIEVTHGNAGSFSVEPDECTFYVGSLTDNYEATIVITLAPEFVAPEVEEGVSGTVLYYKAYEPDLLELLHDNGVEGVDENTKIEGVSFHFVDDYYLSEDTDLDKILSAGNNLMYFHLAAGLSNVSNDNTPNNIRYVEIEYTLNGGSKTSVKIYSDGLYYAKDGDHTYRIESIDREDSIVIFYKERTGGDYIWDPWDVHFVTTGDNFADHKMPSDPEYDGNITFINWDHNENGGDPFLPYEDITDNTVLYGQVLLAGNQGGTVFHVMNTNGTLIGRFLELYNAEHPENSDTDVEIKKIKVSGSNVSTNPDYTSNDWAGNSHYVVHNNSTGTTNDHVPLNDVKTVTLYGAVGAVGGNPYEVTIPISSDPGCFSLASINTAGGGGRGIVAELIINPDPNPPTEEELTGDPDEPDDTGLLGNNAVTINCTNETVKHEDKTYGLEKGTTGELKTLYNANTKEVYFGYVITVQPDKYVEQYNENYTETPHELDPANQAPKTITLVYDADASKWTLPEGAAPVEYTVKCDTQQGGGGDEGPDAPTEGDINSALTDIIAVKCDQTDKHTTTDLTKYFSATKDNATITEPADGVQEDGEGNYTYTITVSLTNEQRDAFIKQFDSTGKHTFKNYDPENGKLEVTLNYVPSAQTGHDDSYTWAPFESSDLLNIYVTCKGGSGGDPGDDGEKPNPPTDKDIIEALDDVEALVTIDCTATDANHGPKTYGIGDLDVSKQKYAFAKNDVTGNAKEGYFTNVTILPWEFIAKYTSDVRNDAHKLDPANQQYKSVTLKWDNNDWVLAEKVSEPIEYTVTCDVETDYVEVPGDDEVIYVPVKPEDPTDPDQTGVADLLETDDHIQYLFGYPDGSFGPDRNMTRAEAAQMFYNLLKNQNVDAEPAFDDVPDGAWYATAVNIMAELGIVDGVGDDKFEPNREITRAEFTTMAMRFADVPSGGVNIFTDVAPSDWFYSYVVNSIQYGWIEGYGDGTFRPDRLITRAEVTTIVNRMLDRQADMAFVIQNRDKLTKFTDLTTEHWAYYTIVEATNEHNYKKPAIGEDWTSLKK